MRNERAWGLLGGYATDSLTAEERKTLLEAALEDQELFNALQNEQPLKELLDDPASRRDILAQLRGGRAQTHGRWWAWTGVAAAAGICMAVIVYWNSTASVVPTRQALAVKPGPPTIQSFPEKELARDLKASPARILELRKDARLPPPQRKSAPLTVGGALGGAMAFRSKANAISSKMIATNLSEPKIPYILLRRAEDGTFESVPQGATLRANDVVRVRMRPGTGTLTISEIGADGTWKPLGAKITTVADQDYDLPAEGAAGRLLMLTFEPLEPGVPAVVEMIPIQRK